MSITLFTDVDNNMAELKQAVIATELRKVTGDDGDFISLRFGEVIHTTTLGTLRKAGGFLEALVNGNLPVKTDSQGRIMVDRSGEHFKFVLQYLRNGSGVNLPEDKVSLKDVLTEATFYCLTGLQEMCKDMLDSMDVKAKFAEPKFFASVIIKSRHNDGPLIFLDTNVQFFWTTTSNIKPLPFRRCGITLPDLEQVLTVLTSSFEQVEHEVKDAGAAEGVISIWRFKSFIQPKTPD